MTEKGFEKLIHYLEGAFREKLEVNERDAYWLSLAQDDDEGTFRRAIAYVRGERARYGFPKPGDIAKPEQQEETHPAYVAAREFERLYGGPRQLRCPEDETEE